jgi:hypothetical protein
LYSSVIAEYVYQVVDRSPSCTSSKPPANVVKMKGKRAKRRGGDADHLIVWWTTSTRVALTDTNNKTSREVRSPLTFLVHDHVKKSIVRRRTR